MYATAPAMAPLAATWAGLYIGGNVGYGWGNGDVADVGASGPVGAGIAALFLSAVNGAFDPKPKGVIGGAQIGYNWQMGSLVTGLEADFQGSGIKGSFNRSTLIVRGDGGIDGSALSIDEKLSWFGTVRGRFGATVTPNLLLYGTAGLAYGRVNNSATTRAFDNDPASPVPVDYSANVGKVKAGWAAGAGAEWMFANNWSAKVEYLHIDLGNVSMTNTAALSFPSLGGSSVNYTWKTQENIVRAGVNYHF